MKILIVDDSVVFRSSIKMALDGVPGFQIHKAVSNGKLAVEEVRNNPDIDMITLDMEMPVMDGMETVKEIRSFNKEVKIIIFASPTSYGAERTIKVLNFGANDFVTKIEGQGTIESSIIMITENLVPKMKALAGIVEEDNEENELPDYSILSGGDSSKTSIASDNKTTDSDVNFKAFTNINQILDDIAELPDLILLASSTGGPSALTSFFNSLDVDLPVPMLLVQHMPPVFTTKLAESLSNLSQVQVKEAKDGDQLQNGVCYLAPGDYHMTLNKNLTLNLNQDEKVCYVRPSADVLFDSVAKNFSGKILTIIFTGMGKDGTDGCVELRKKSANIVVQDEESSVVWGMPGAVVRRGLSPHVLSLKELPQLLNLLTNQ